MFGKMMAMSEGRILLFLGILLSLAIACTCAPSGDLGADDGSNEVLKRGLDDGGFGRDDDMAPFMAGKGDRFMDWKTVLDRLPSKRQLSSYVGSGSFDASPSVFGNSNLQNWNKYFNRRYRSFLAPNHGSVSGGGQLGYGGHFGTDGLQNWRAFFESRRGGFRK